MTEPEQATSKAGGCLGVVVVLALIVVVRSLTGHGDTSPTTASAASPSGRSASTSTSTPQSAGSAKFNVGQPATDSDVVFTIDKLRESTGVTFGGRRQTPQGVWLGAWVEVANNGKDPIYVLASAQDLIDAAGRRYETDTMAELYFGWDSRADESAPINPGNRTQLLFIWDVPAGTSVDHLVLHESPGSDGAWINTELALPPNNSRATDGTAPSAAGVGADCGQAAGYSVQVNAKASCEFAFNVAKAFAESHASSVSAYSPVTQTMYTLSCTGSGPVVCVAGKGAEIILN